MIDQEQLIDQITFIMASVVLDPALISNGIPALSVDERDLRLMARAALYVVIGAYGIET